VEVIEEHIDDLLRIYTQCSLKNEQETPDGSGDISQCAIENGNLEGILIKRRDEFQQSVAQFAIQEERQKEAIHAARLKSTFREQELLDQIAGLRRRLAESVLN
jgi:hypothetical protein